MGAITYKTSDELLDGIKTYLETNGSQLTDWNVGSILRSLSEPTADVGRILMDLIYQVALQRFVTHSSGDSLDDHGADYSQTRKDGSVASSSQCKFTINLQSSVFTVPLGTVVNTNDPIPRYYETTEEGIIDAGDAEVIVPIQSLEKGEKYNCPAHYISTVQNLAGIIAVDNLTACTGGSDTETDEEYKARLLLYFAEGLARATRNALVFGALTVDGVKSAVPRSNLKDHWEDYSCVANEFTYTGSWSDEAGSYYYGIRKEGIGTATLKAIMRKCIIHLWKTTAGGECTLSVDGVEETIDLSGDTLAKITIEKEFDSETWHEIKLDTGTNIGSIEKIEAKANYQGTNFIYIDDGTGQPSWELVRNVYDELENWVSSGEQLFVKRTEILTVDLSITVTVNTRVNRDALTILITNAVTDYMESLKMGEILDESQLKAAVINASANIKTAKTNITTIAPLNYQIIRPGTIGVLYG